MDRPLPSVAAASGNSAEAAFLQPPPLQFEEGKRGIPSIFVFKRKY